jgi:hypothetical protein
MIKKTTKVALAAGAALTIAAALYLILPFHKDTSPQMAGLTRVQAYDKQGVCAALLPECGLCYGKVIDKECYVDKAKLTAEQLRHMGF